MAAKNIIRYSLVLLLLAQLLVFPRPTAAQGTVLRFAELGYGDRTAFGIDAVLDYYFPIPTGLRPLSDGRLTLRFTHSPLLRADRSTLSVVLNGRALSSVRLTPDNADGGELSVALPIAGFDGPGLFIQVRLHMRLTDDACEEVQNPALWTVVHGDSTLQIDLQPVESGTLADLAALFAPLPLSAPTVRSPPTIVLSPLNEAATRAAAGQVAFAIGRWAALARQDPVLTVADTVPDRSPAIVVALASLPASDWGSVRWNGRAYEVDGQEVPTEHGLLALAPTSPPRLLVAGATPTALQQAALALIRPLPAESVVAVTQLPPQAEAEAWRNGAASFAQLGVEQRKVTGAGEHQIDLAFERPAHWDLRVGGTLDLHITAAAGLTAQTSWVTAIVNGITLGSQRLRIETNSPESYRFALPADLLNSDLEGTPIRWLNLQIRLYLDLPNIGCEEVDTSAAWAVIEPTSAWRLPNDPAAANDLGRFPATLLADKEARLVLPDQPTLGDVHAGLELAAAVGRWAAIGDMRPPLLLTANEIGDDRRGPLAVLGHRERHPLIAMINPPNDIPFVYRPGRTVAATLRIVPSPWQADSRVLIIEAADSDGLRLGVQALRERELLQVLRGNQAQLAANPNPTVLLSSSPLAAPPQTLTPRVEVVLLERFPAWQVVGAILLLALVATAILVIRIRWLRRR